MNDSNMPSLFGEVELLIGLRATTNSLKNVFFFNSQTLDNFLILIYSVLSSLYDAFITEMRQKLHLIVIIAGTWDMAGN